MEKNVDEKDQEYKKGFNDGYLLAKYMPDLAEKLGKTDGSSDRIEGFENGKQQWAIEKENIRLKSPDMNYEKSNIDSKEDLDREPER